MALTSGGFANGQGSPDKHVVSGAATGLPVTGNYSDTNASGEVPDLSTGMESSEAKAIYGTPDGGASRVQRVQSVGAQASDHSTGDGSGASVGSAFIDQSSFHGWTDC